jgi:hypothetical protein
MTQRFPPPGYAEVAAPPARKTLYECLPGDTVLLCGQVLYLGEFRQGIESGAKRVPARGNYALLWHSRADHRESQPYQVMAASRSHPITLSEAAR